MVPILGSSGSFYDEVLRELVVRARRRAVRRQRVRAVSPPAPTRRPPRSARSRAAGRAARYAATGAPKCSDLPQAPLARTVTYLLIGFVVMIAGLGAIINK